MKIESAENEIYLQTHLAAGTFGDAKFTIGIAGTKILLSIDGEQYKMPLEDLVLEFVDHHSKAKAGSE